eukprot:SAG11_NODE_1730_length_4364_cov_1.545369_3_plen_109_part_00
MLSAPGMDDWVFEVGGVGVAPTVMEALHVTAACNIPSSEVLEFLNPFEQRIEISLELQTDEPRGVFEVCDSSVFYHPCVIPRCFTIRSDPVPGETWPVCDPSVFHHPL